MAVSTQHLAGAACTVSVYLFAAGAQCAELEPGQRTLWAQTEELCLSVYAGAQDTNSLPLMGAFKLLQARLKDTGWTANTAQTEVRETRIGGGTIKTGVNVFDHDGTRLIVGEAVLQSQSLLMTKGRLETSGQFSVTPFCAVQRMVEKTGVFGETLAQGSGSQMVDQVNTDDTLDTVFVLRRGGMDVLVRAQEADGTGDGPATLITTPR